MLNCNYDGLNYFFLYKDERKGLELLIKDEEPAEFFKDRKENQHTSNMDRIDEVFNEICDDEMSL